MTANDNWPEHIQQRAAAVRLRCFFHRILYNDIYVLQLLKLHTFMIQEA